MIATVNLLGKGIYTAREAAVYSRVKTQTANRWLFGSAGGNAVITPEFSDGEKIVTFLDFIQLLAIRAIRVKHKIQLSEIRQAVELAREEGIDYPFAVEHKTFLFGDPNTKGHGKVVIEVNGRLMQASGSGRRNWIMRPVAELYLRDLHYDAKSHLASRYYPFGAELNNRVVMDPKITFGEPILADSGYSAEVLYEAYQVEGGVEAAARAYGVDTSDVEVALRYFDLLSPNSA